MKIENFWEIDAWQEARSFTREVYNATSDREFAKDIGLKDQIRRSAVSVMANVAEGFSRGNGEFAGYLMSARASNSETQSHLYLAFDLGYVDSDDFWALLQQSNRVERALNAFIGHVKSNEKNNKFNIARLVA